MRKKAAKLFRKLLSADQIDSMIEHKDLNDPLLSAQRLKTCKKNAGICYRPKEDVCTECVCLMKIKVTYEMHRDPLTGQTQITHCPLGKWKDKDIANHYRELNNKPLLK